MPEIPSPGLSRRAVFDANLFIQALLSGRGPAFACLGAVTRGGVTLFVTEAILEEVEEVLMRLSQKPMYENVLVRDAIEAFMADLRRIAEVAPEPPHVFDLARDPDDEVYIDLALATGAAFLASREEDLLDLMDTSTEAGAEFRLRFPDLAILDPVEFLRRIQP